MKHHHGSPWRQLSALLRSVLLSGLLVPCLIAVGLSGCSYGVNSQGTVALPIREVRDWFHTENKDLHLYIIVDRSKLEPTKSYSISVSSEIASNSIILSALAQEVSQRASPQVEIHDLAIPNLNAGTYKVVDKVTGIQLAEVNSSK